MKLTITEKYLVLPINPSVREKHITISDENGTVVFDFDVPLDAVNPKYKSYINVERFIGGSYYVSISPDAKFACSLEDRMPDDGIDEARPFVHYTTHRGWLSDPNGLFYYGGEYHMMYQYNPAAPVWGRSMHWGHATSYDLIHWTELDPVLYPDEDGAMFSGSAWVDSENASGLGDGENSPILLFYTAAGGVTEQSAMAGKSFTQCMAYSLDGGRTFVKYDKNPLIPCILSENRDPRVMYSAEMKKYVMLLYMENNRYTLFTSENLLLWESAQDIELKGDNECPDFYPLKSIEGEVLWVFSGGNDYYTVGKMTRQGFSPVQNPRPFNFGGRCSHAGQVFVSTDFARRGSIADRCVRLIYENMHMTDLPFENQIGFPTEMSLSKFGDIYRLRAVPVREIEKLYVSSELTENVSVKKKIGFSRHLEIGAYDLKLRCKKTVSPFTITLFGVSLYISPEENRITLENSQNIENDMPLSFSMGEIELRILYDTAGIELFADGGLICYTSSVQSDYGMSYLRLDAQENTVIDSLEINRLKSARPMLGKLRL